MSIRGIRRKWRSAFKFVSLLAIASLIAMVPVYFHSVATFTRHADDAGSTPDLMRTVANSGNAFGIDLYRNIEDNESNTFFSPWSITSAMLMLQEGARGQTAEEIAGVFHLSAMESIRPNYAGIYNVLYGTREYSLHTVNAMWHEQTHLVNEKYIQTVDRYYCGDIHGLDFLHQPDVARGEINDWIKKTTNNKIQDLLQPGSIKPSMELILTNAIYFAGAWVRQFDPDKTSDGVFHSSEGDVSVPYMRFTSTPHINYTENCIMQMIELPYKGGRLSMFVVLPKEDMATLEDHLSTTNLTRWETEMDEEYIHVVLPSFILHESYDLGEELVEMGMPTAFSPALADLSGIDGTRANFVSSVIHKSYISVDEVGTEAAAATAINVECGTPSISFAANHPFLFYIQERVTGAILFMGALQNPAA